MLFVTIGGLTFRRQDPSRTVVSEAVACVMIIEDYNVRCQAKRGLGAADGEEILRVLLEKLG